MTPLTGARSTLATIVSTHWPTLVAETVGTTVPPLSGNSIQAAFWEADGVWDRSPTLTDRSVDSMAVAAWAASWASAVVTSGSPWTGSRVLRASARPLAASWTAVSRSPRPTVLPGAPGATTNEPLASSQETVASWGGLAREELSLWSRSVTPWGSMRATTPVSRWLTRERMRRQGEALPLTAALAVADASTWARSPRGTVSVVPSTLIVTVAVAARRVTRSSTWARSIPETSCPATVVPGRACPK